MRQKSMKMNEEKKRWNPKKSVKPFAPLVSMILVFLMIFSLAGCSLAHEEGAGKEADKLIGGFVTRHPLNEKIYAKAEWVNVVKGGRHPFEVEFEGVEGQLFLCYESYLAGEEVYDIRHNGNTSSLGHNIRKDENGEYIEIKATLHYMPRVKEEINEFYLNPVYLTAEEEIYAMPGRSISTGGGMNSQGTKLSLSHSEEIAWTLQDERKVERVEIKVELEAVYEPLSIMMYQMTEDHKVIKEEEFVPEETFTEVRVEPETAYVHMVTEQLLPDGRTVHIREILDWEGETMDLYDDDSEKPSEYRITNLYSYYGVGDGFLKKDWSIVVWPK